MENMKIKTVKLEMRFDKEVGEVTVVAEVPQYVADVVKTFGIQDGHSYIIYEEAGEIFQKMQAMIVAMIAVMVMTNTQTTHQD